MTDELAPSVIEIPQPPEFIVEPVHVMRPLAGYDSIYAVLVSLGDHTQILRHIDANVPEDPLQLLKFVIFRANPAVKSMINQAYHGRLEMRVGNNSYGFHEWSIIFKDLPSYRPCSSARIVEVSPGREN